MKIIKQPKKIVKETTKIAQDLNASTRERIRCIVEENDTKEGQLFDFLIEILIIFSIINYSIGTLPNLSPLWIKIVNWIDIICYITFTIEYVARIYISKKPLKYIFSFYGLVDLFAILPFVFGRQFDLRALRALRVLRIMSALKMSRYSESLQRFATAIKLIKPDLILFLIVSNVFIFLSASGIYFFERDAQPENFASIFHSLWWAIVTLTTVGYGDVYPITWGGRALTYVILLIGLGIITIPTGIIASALSQARENALQEQKEKMEKEQQETDNNTKEKEK